MEVSSLFFFQGKYVSLRLSFSIQTNILVIYYLVSVRHYSPVDMLARMLTLFIMPERPTLLIVTDKLENWI